MCMCLMVFYFTIIILQVFQCLSIKKCMFVFYFTIFNYSFSKALCINLVFDVPFYVSEALILPFFLRCRSASDIPYIFVSLRKS